MLAEHMAYSRKKKCYNLPAIDNVYYSRESDLVRKTIIIYLGMGQYSYIWMQYN